MKSWSWRATLGLAVVLLFGVPTSFADELPRAKPDREGLSAERLDRLTQHMQQAVTDGVMVGGAAAIARNGKVVYEREWGMSDREAAKPMTRDAIYRIYSMSKPITSVAVMILYEEGKFFLNDPVARYLPALADLEVAVSTADSNTQGVSDGTTSRTVGTGDTSVEGQRRAPTRQPTILDLLRHTAGFTYGFFGETEVDKLYRAQTLMPPESDLNTFVTKLGDLPLQYDPGTRWHYSVAVDVQGALVEAVSGMRFSEFLDTRLFGPLGMVDTSFVVPEAKQSRFVQLYSPEGTANRPDAFLQPSTSTNLVVAAPEISNGFKPGARFEGGGGGMVSTTEDYLRFSQMMLNGGELDGVRILSPKTVELITTNHLGDDLQMGLVGNGYGFGLGFAVAQGLGQMSELGSEGEYNWGGAAGTRFWVDPEEELIGVFMVQSLPHRTRLGSEFKVLTYQAIVD